MLRAVNISLQTWISLQTAQTPPQSLSNSDKLGLCINYQTQTCVYAINIWVICSRKKTPTVSNSGLCMFGLWKSPITNQLCQCVMRSNPKHHKTGAYQQHSKTQTQAIIPPCIHSVKNQIYINLWNASDLWKSIILCEARTCSLGLQILGLWHSVD